MESKDNKKSPAEIIDQRKKIMVVGITLVMLVVAGLWAFNIKSFVNPYSENLIKSDQQKLNWQDVKGRFENTMNDVISKMDKLDAQRQAGSVSASTSLDNLENNLNAKIHSSSTVSTTSENVKFKLDALEKDLEKK